MSKMDFHTLAPEMYGRSRKNETFEVNETDADEDLDNVATIFVQLKRRPMGFTPNNFEWY